MGIIASIIVGIIAGWLAEKIMKRDHGLLTNLIVGLIGGLIGGLVLKPFGFDSDAVGWIMNIVAGTLGAVILLWILGLVKGKSAEN